MKDSLLLMDIYKRYLNVTHDLISILERSYEKENGNPSEELRKKFKEFRQHAHGLIESLNQDLHSLLRIDWELKEIEDREKRTGE